MADLVESLMNTSLPGPAAANASNVTKNQREYFHRGVKATLSVLDVLSISIDVLVSGILSISRIRGTKSHVILLNSQCADIVEGCIRVSTKFLGIHSLAADITLDARAALSSARIFCMALLLMNLYFAVVRAGEYKKIFTWSRTVVLIVAVWVLNLALFGLTARMSYMVMLDTQIRSQALWTLSLITILGIQALPLCASGVCYWLMIRFRHESRRQGFMHLADTAVTREVLARAIFRLLVFCGIISIIIFVGRYIFNLVDDAISENVRSDNIGFTVMVHAFHYVMVAGKVSIFWSFFPPFRSTLQRIVRCQWWENRVAAQTAPAVEEVVVVSGNTQGLPNMMPRLPVLVPEEEEEAAVFFKAKIPGFLQSLGKGKGKRTGKGGKQGKTASASPSSTSRTSPVTSTNTASTATATTKVGARSANGKSPTQ